MIGQLAGAQAGVPGVVLPVDELHAIHREALGELRHQHLVAAVVIPVGLFNVGEEGVAHHLAQSEPGDISVHQQHPAGQTVGLEIVQHLVGLFHVLPEGGGGLLPALGVVVQKGGYPGDVLRDDGPELPAAVIALAELVHVVALAAEFFTFEILQILRPVEIIGAVPVGDGGGVGEEGLQGVQFLPGDGVEGNGDPRPTAVGRQGAVVLLPVGAQREGEGHTQIGSVDFEIERAAVLGEGHPVQVPPDEGGAGGGVAQPAGVHVEVVAQPGQVVQGEGTKIQHIAVSLVMFSIVWPDRRP